MTFERVYEYTDRQSDRFLFKVVLTTSLCQLSQFVMLLLPLLMLLPPVLSAVAAAAAAADIEVKNLYFGFLGLLYLLDKRIPLP